MSISSTSSPFVAVTKLFQSTELAEKVANLFDRTYQEGIGKIEDYRSFTAVENPQMVAMNLAGLYAADTAANMIGILRRHITNDHLFSEDDYVDIMRKIVDGNVTEDDHFAALQCANLAWRAGQPFRDIGTNPLNRITRNVNMQFNLLSEEEQGKDWVQIQTGAKIILNYIEHGTVDL